MYVLQSLHWSSKAGAQLPARDGELLRQTVQPELCQYVLRLVCAFSGLLVLPLNLFRTLDINKYVEMAVTQCNTPFDIERKKHELSGST